MGNSVGSHRLYWDSTDNPLYEAWAVRANSDTSQALWKIKKYIWVTGSGGNPVLSRELFADGNSLYDNILDNRTSLSYL